MVNYNQISRVYDQVRAVDRAIIERLLAGVTLDASSTVLDIGCGTGNYGDVLQRITQAHVYGLDQSQGMLAQARLKNAQVEFCHGDAQRLPFTDAFFDFVYMTDVIHHVADMARLLAEMGRVLKPDGRACVVTQSHAQIARRPIAQFFPETVTVDRARYPDIPVIVAAAEAQGLRLLRVEISGEGDRTLLDQRFLEQVRSRGYSMLHLIADEAYAHGLVQVEACLRQGDLAASRAGETLVWLCHAEP